MFDEFHAQLELQYFDIQRLMFGWPCAFFALIQFVCTVAVFGSRDLLMWHNLSMDVNGNLRRVFCLPRAEIGLQSGFLRHVKILRVCVGDTFWENRRYRHGCAHWILSFGVVIMELFWMGIFARVRENPV